MKLAHFTAHCGSTSQTVQPSTWFTLIKPSLNLILESHMTVKII